MNPFLKTLISQFAGLFGGAILTAVDHPTGGFANTLATNPEVAIAYVSLASLAHNLISKYLPPAPPEPATATTSAK